MSSANTQHLFYVVIPPACSHCLSDIVGYTALTGKDAERTLELVRVNKGIQKPLVEKHNGKWIKEMGDDAMAQFESALDAVKCAIDIQKAAQADLDAKLRIGIHLGDIPLENSDIYGDGLNVAHGRIHLRRQRRLCFRCVRKGNPWSNGYSGQIPGDRMMEGVLSHLNKLKNCD